jgi:hypothetical protein
MLVDRLGADFGVFFVELDEEEDKNVIRDFLEGCVVSLSLM